MTDDDLTEAERRRRIELLAHAYRTVFGESGNRSREQLIVMADLRKFCRPDEPTFSATDRETCLREGRREVFLRINSPLVPRDPTLTDLLADPGWRNPENDE
jgi:IS5 family transposase